MPKLLHLTLYNILFWGMLLQSPLYAQTELQAWGNITGVRANGQLIRFESSLRLVKDDWRKEQATGRERHWTSYRREGATQIVRTVMDSLFFTKTVRDGTPGKAQIEVIFDPHEDMDLIGAFFHLALPAKDFAAASINLIQPAGLNLSENPVMPVGGNEVMRARAIGLDVATAERTIKITADSALQIIVKTDPKTGNLGLYFTLQAAQAKAGQKVLRLFEVSVAANTEVVPAELQLFPNYPGNAFLGLGGIFGNDRIPLQPTQRFWNLKQLAQTPKNLHILPLTCSSDDLYAAALGDLKLKNYAFHLVNEGPEREVILSGLPEKVKRLQVYMTDATKNMERGATLKIENGEVQFSIGAACFVSLMSE